MDKYRARVRLDIEGWAYEQSDLEDIVRDWLSDFSDIRVLKLEVDFENPPGNARKGNST